MYSVHTTGNILYLFSVIRYRSIKIPEFTGVYLYIFYLVEMIVNFVVAFPPFYLTYQSHIQESDGQKVSLGVYRFTILCIQVRGTIEGVGTLKNAQYKVYRTRCTIRTICTIQGVQFRVSNARCPYKTHVQNTRCTIHVVNIYIHLEVNNARCTIQGLKYVVSIARCP